MPGFNYTQDGRRIGNIISLNEKIVGRTDNRKSSLNKIFVSIFTQVKLVQNDKYKYCVNAVDGSNLYL